jgi:hypothetical protein
MAKKCIWLITLVPLFAFQTMPASACNVVGHASDGEELCGTTSDGPGQPYTDARHEHYARERARERSHHTEAQYVNRHGLDILRRR